MLASILEQRLRGLLGVLIFVVIAWLLSRHRNRFPWRIVLWGLGLQLVLGFILLRWEPGIKGLQVFSAGVKHFLELSQEGGKLVFGRLGDHGSQGQFGFVMAFMVLPTIIFFSSFMAILYHLGIMQFLIRGIAWVMARTMKTSGSESLSAAANIFVGQSEAPLVVRPFIEKMTASELMAIMTGGFATIAGGVFALYVGFGIPPGYLIVASVMSAPAALVIAKVMLPETEKSATMGDIKLKVPRDAGNLVEAAAGGALDGLKLALNVGAMLIAFLGLVAVVNAGLASVHAGLDWAGMNGLDIDYFSLQGMLGIVFTPFAYVLGVAGNDVVEVGRVLGTKIAVNELVAYTELTGTLKDQISPRSFMIASFALCGFANLGSVGIQLGGIGGIAPSRRPELARLAMRAMLAGAFASWMTAALAGVLL